MQNIIKSKNRAIFHQIKLAAPLLACILSACGGSGAPDTSEAFGSSPVAKTAPSLSVVTQQNFALSSGGVDVNAVNQSISNFNAGK
jgi:hypothetical protein